MSSPQVPKYQAIYSLLRARILDGEHAPGTQLPSQQELAESFNVTLMTLRQAVSALESEGLVRAEPGKGTFVADRPVDIRLGNLSSFAEEMRAAGVAMTTELLEISNVAVDEHPLASASLAINEAMLCIVRRRSADGEPFALQRSYLAEALGVAEPGSTSVGESLYSAIEAATGWIVSEAQESITAISIGRSEARLLACKASQPALRSVRVSINQFGQPFLYDEAVLVGDRCAITADRHSDRLALQYNVTGPT